MFYNKFDENILGSSLLAVGRYLRSKGTSSDLGGRPSHTQFIQFDTLSLTPHSPAHSVVRPTHSFIFIVKRHQITVGFLNLQRCCGAALPDSIMRQQALILRMLRLSYLIDALYCSLSHS